MPEQVKNSEIGKALTGQLLFLELAAKTEGIEALTQRIYEASSDHATRFDLSICQAAPHKYRDAMENLLAIQKAEPTFKDGAAQEMMVTLVNMLSPRDPLWPRIIDVNWQICGLNDLRYYNLQE